MKLDELQREFMAYVRREPTRAEAIEAPPALLRLLRDVNPHGLAIYRNAYTARLIGVLESDHEKLTSFVGTERFADIARLYVASHPSTVRSLRYFGDHFPNFLRSLEAPDADLLAELCAFERTLLDVYDAPDATPIAFEEISAIAPEHWPSLRLDFHPSLRLFAAPHGSVSCWQHLHAGREFDSTRIVDDPQATWRLWRNPERISQFQLVDPLERTALTGFGTAGSTLASVAEELVEQNGDQDLVVRLNQWLRDWCTQGLLISATVATGITPHER